MHSILCDLFQRPKCLTLLLCCAVGSAVEHGPPLGTAGSVMEAASDRIIIEVYRNKIMLETKQYWGSSRTAEEILSRLRDNQMVGDLREGDLPISVSDNLESFKSYQLHLAEPGVICCDTVFVHSRLHAVLSLRLLLDESACITLASPCLLDAFRPERASASLLCIIPTLAHALLII